jgi:hypothetical protein
MPAQAGIHEFLCEAGHDAAEDRGLEELSFTDLRAA